MATQSKTQYLADLQAYLKRRYKLKAAPDPVRLSVIDAVVYGICHEDTTREQANQALSRFKDQFFDWNEVRVSPLEEVQETLADVPDPASRAQRIRRFLRQLFEKTYSFTALDALAKKPLKEALKTFEGFEAFSSDYVMATVIQQALGGHAIPIDESARKALESLGLQEEDVPTLRSMIERAIPKNRGAEFVDILEELSQDSTIASDPKAPRWVQTGKASKAEKPKPAAEESAKPAAKAKPDSEESSAKESKTKAAPPSPPKKGKGKPGDK